MEQQRRHGRIPRAAARSWNKNVNRMRWLTDGARPRSEEEVATMDAAEEKRARRAAKRMKK